jgi:hypothetical protein
MVTGPISPIVYGMNGPVLIGGQPVHQVGGRVVAIGNQSIHRVNDRSVAVGNEPVHHSMNTEISEEVGGLPITRGKTGQPSAVVGPRIGPPSLPSSVAAPGPSPRSEPLSTPPPVFSFCLTPEEVREAERAGRELLGRLHLRH